MGLRYMYIHTSTLAYSRLAGITKDSTRRPLMATASATGRGEDCGLPEPFVLLRGGYAHG